MPDLDLKIVGGTLVDGTGAERRRADIGVRDGRVVAVGDVPAAARQTVDAGGRVVAPGFVDIHTHYDAQVLWDPLLTVSPWHGVTTAVLGNCGFGVAPTRPQHRDLILRTLERVEARPLEPPRGERLEDGLLLGGRDAEERQEARLLCARRRGRRLSCACHTTDGDDRSARLRHP